MSNSYIEPGADTRGAETDPSLPLQSGGELVPPARAFTSDAGFGAAIAGLAMKRRSPAGVWLGLPLLTIGVYPFVWLYRVHTELAEFDRRRSISATTPLLVVFLLGWTLIGPLIVYHNLGTCVRNAQRSAGLTPTCSQAASWLLAFIFGLNSLYIQTELNKVVGCYKGTPAGITVPLAV